MLRGFYILMASGLTAWWLWAALGGREWRTPERSELPASVRSSPGGYRSFHFWHTGYHGGK
jgi:hypothetical protein